MRNSGSVIGGAINFSTNYKISDAGGIAWSTYLIFIAFGKQTQNRAPYKSDEKQSAPVSSGPCPFLLLDTSAVEMAAKFPPRKRFPGRRSLKLCGFTTNSREYDCPPSYVDTRVIDTAADHVNGGPVVLLLLLRRNHGHLPLAPLFRACPCIVVPPCP